MGKQTKQKGSHFGGEWTIQKLHIIEEYLKTYTTALKNQKVKKIYVFRPLNMYTYYFSL